MDKQRRLFLRAFAPAALIAAASVTVFNSALGRAQQASNPPVHPPPINPNPKNPAIPPIFRTPTHAELRKNQQEITKDVDQLFTLAQQLKRQADKSDASEELSVALIDKTEQIEKLAKKIRDLARA
ncbi:MAG TPA: hypothetical protein VN745_05625 [Verrucomicrobiae bacterium]|nr:hypothetical protein [Verrucomicrobiae bacterium]